MAKNPPSPSVAARFDPDPNHYLLTEVEFNRLCEVARIPEKENVFFMLGLLIPCAINAYTSLPEADKPASVAFILNFIVVAVTGLMVFFQARGWYAKRKTFQNFVRDLKDRPEGRLAFAAPPTQMVVNPPSKEG